MSRPHLVVLSLLLSTSTPAAGVLVLAKRLRAGLCSCAPAADTGGQHAKIAVLKVPRTGSTWLAKELRAFSGVQLEFEPFTDGSSAQTCAGRFFTQALGKALAARLRCVTRETRAQPCYWAWQGCNASRLQPRPVGRDAGPTVLTGFLINPMYAPGANWNRALASAGAARYVWLRRTNLIKMALSDLRRLAAASARRMGKGGGNASAALALVEPRTLVQKVNMTLVSQATFPAAIALERGMLVLYEDLQAQRLHVLRGLMHFLGLASLPSVAKELERQAAAEASGEGGGQSTHWQKASEDVCAGLPSGNCARLRVGLRGKPCLLSQLKSRKPTAWSFPNYNGTLSLQLLDAPCAKLPPLRRTLPPAAGVASACPSMGQQAAGYGSRSLYDLYGTALPTWPDASGASCEGVQRKAIIAKSHVLPYSLSAAAQTEASAGASTSGRGQQGAGEGRVEMVGGGPAAGEAGLRTGGKGEVRFVIFSRQRSASTTFVGLLNLHPSITCRWEAFSNSFTATKMRSFLGVANRSAQLEDIPEYMRRFWSACPTKACGLKLLNGQIRPVERVKQLFSVAGDASPLPVVRLLLERADVMAEFESWRKAQNTGNWGTSPEAQSARSKAAAAASASSADPAASRLAFRARKKEPLKKDNSGCRGCDAESIAKNQAMANSIGPGRFAAQHRSWFKFAREVNPSMPLLHLYSENLTSSMASCNRTMAAVYTFLRLPPLAENCDLAKIPTEWPCDIQADPTCSLEKYAKPAAGGAGSKSPQAAALSLNDDRRT